ncbi:MAG: VWA domain-containing protein [Polyangiaceae bacterium]
MKLGTSSISAGMKRREWLLGGSAVLLASACGAKSDKPAAVATSEVVQPQPVQAPPPQLLGVELATSPKLIAADKEASIFLRVRVKGLAIDTGTRPTLNLVLVVDTSGSMEGSAIERAKAACATLVEAMRDGDIVSIVTFGARPHVIVPSSVLDKKARASAAQAISAIVAEGTTDMAGGLTEGLNQARAHLRSDGINRMVLVGDGVPNDPAPIGPLADQAKQMGIAITTLGLGPDFDETLMASVAQRSGGSFHFVDDASKVATVFEREITRLDRLVSRSTAVALVPGPGVAIEDVVGWPEQVSGRGVYFDLGSLSEGDQRDAIVKVRVSAHRNGSKAELVDATISYVQAVAGASMEVTQFASLQVTSDAAALQDATVPEIEHQAARLTVADGIVTAIASARAGDVAGAKTKLDQVVQLAARAGKQFDDSDLLAKATEAKQLKKTVASLAPPPVAEIDATGGRQPQPAPMTPAAAMEVRGAHGNAMDEIQGL